MGHQSNVEVLDGQTAHIFVQRFWSPSKRRYLTHIEMTPFKGEDTPSYYVLTIEQAQELSDLLSQAVGKAKAMQARNVPGEG